MTPQTIERTSTEVPSRIGVVLRWKLSTHVSTRPATRDESEFDLYAPFVFIIFSANDVNNKNWLLN